MYRFCTGFSPVLHWLHRLCTKIEKNLTIFCNFFSLCINKLRKSCKNNCSKDLTKSEIVVSLQRV